MNPESFPEIQALLVEDDVDFSRQLTFRLTHQSPPMSVHHATSLADACVILKSQPIDVVLLDLSLPDSQTIETFHRFKAVCSEVPIVILSGLDDNSASVEGVRAGAEDYLVKSEIDGRIIPRLLRSAVERFKIRKELARVTQDLRETNHRLEQMSIRDPMTGLYNRRGFYQVFSRELNWAERNGWRLLALILDLDHFKEVNDEYGYAVGDALLKTVSDSFKAQVRITDHVSRMGGDEFMILLPETSLEEGTHVAERIRQSISEIDFKTPSGIPVPVTISLGLFKVPADVISIDLLLSHAHPLIKASKEKGRNCLTVREYSSSELRDPLDTLSGELKRMRDGQSFRAVKQAIYDLEKNTPKAFELFSRFESKYHSLPKDFFRVATENNILSLVDHHCLKNCVEAAKEIPEDLMIHINILPSTLREISSELLAALFGEMKQVCCLEISQKNLEGDVYSLLGALSVIRKDGTLLALDDVGFGHSSLETILMLEPDILKLDPCYVHGIAREAGRKKALSRLLAFAGEIQADVIAEGIEDETDLEMIKGMGVVTGQGFYLARPD